jgi:hypothetical protein
MILASQLIKDSDGTQKLILFLYVGIVFILIGVGKYIFKSVLKKNDVKPLHIPKDRQIGRKVQAPPTLKQTQWARENTPPDYLNPPDYNGPLVSERHARSQKKRSHPHHAHQKTHPHPVHHAQKAQAQQKPANSTHQPYPSHPAHPSRPQHKLSHMSGKHEIHRAQQPQHLTIIGCPVCGTRHYSYADFCMKCGAKMK